MVEKRGKGRRKKKGKKRKENEERGKRRKDGDNTHIWHLISLLDNSAIVVSFVWCVFCLQAAAFQ